MHCRRGSGATKSPAPEGTFVVACHHGCGDMQIVNLYLAARQKLLILIRLSDYSAGLADGDVLRPKDNPVGMVIQERARRNGTVRRRRQATARDDWGRDIIIKWDTRGAAR